jgi:hypothetical protein
MTIGTFEDLNLQPGEHIFFTNLSGNGFNGIYRGNYNRSKAAFDFLNFNGSRIETVNLKDIQVLQRNS